MVRKINQLIADLEIQGFHQDLLFSKFMFSRVFHTQGLSGRSGEMRTEQRFQY